MADVQTSPGENAAEVTASDSTTLYSRGLYVGGSGDVVVTMYGNGAEVTFVGVPSGSVLPIKVSKVMAATTATDIVAIW